jgi:hypothetical protein
MKKETLQFFIMDLAKIYTPWKGTSSMLLK